jgi:hypothetical protein
MSGETSPFAAHVALDVVDGVRREVREATVLQVAPEQFHGVEVRGVGWKPDEVTARMSGPPALHELVLVRASPIPHQDEWTADVAPELAKKAHHLGAPNVASVSCRRRGDTIKAPMPETFSCARANGQRRRQATRGPRAAQYRHHQEAGFIEADQVGAEAPEFFYPAPVTQDPGAHPPIVALLGAGLGPLGAEATRAEQSADVIRMVDDFELTTDEVDDPSTRPQACAIAGRFRPRITRRASRCRCAGLSFGGRPDAGRARSPARPLSSVRALPSADGTPIDAEARRRRCSSSAGLPCGRMPYLPQRSITF